MAFHWNHGWYFARLPSGSVEVRNHGDYEKHDPNCAPGDGRTTLTIDASSWASIVASVSKGGETGESYRAAPGFHENGVGPKWTDAQIKHMVDRFLMWRLPEGFNPDGGVTFQKVSNPGTPYEHKYQPVGTNLFDAAQAEAMVRHMLEGLPD